MVITEIPLWKQQKYFITIRNQRLYFSNASKTQKDDALLGLQKQHELNLAA